MLEVYGIYHWSQWTYKVQGYAESPRYVSLEPVDIQGYAGSLRYVSLEAVNIQGTGICWKPTVCITGASKHTGYRDMLEAHGMYHWSQ